MKVLVTGLNGTLGRQLKLFLEAKGDTVVGWDRKLVPIDQYYPMEDYIRLEKPDMLIHLAVNSKPTGRENENWIVNYQWPSELAWITRNLNIRFVYTSTVMVFSDYAVGPFTIDSLPDNNKGYGFEKRIAEGRIQYQNPDSVTLRLGWQIINEMGSNNMIDYLENQQSTQGSVRCSTRWLPACSFAEDMAAILRDSLTMKPGLYQVDSNKGWNFFEIATALRDKFGKNWDLEPTGDFVFDQRMIDDRVKVNPLSKRLPGLRKLK